VLGEKAGNRMHSFATTYHLRVMQEPLIPSRYIPAAGTYSVYISKSGRKTSCKKKNLLGKQYVTAMTQEVSRCYPLLLHTLETILPLLLVTINSEFGFSLQF
jgi:hypothetical protein